MVRARQCLIEEPPFLAIRRDGDMKLPDINVREIGVRRTEDWNFLMESTRIQALRNYFRIAVQNLDLRGFWIIANYAFAWEPFLAIRRVGLMANFRCRK